MEEANYFIEIGAGNIVYMNFDPYGKILYQITLMQMHSSHVPCFTPCLIFIHKKIVYLLEKYHLF